QTTGSGWLYFGPDNNLYVTSTGNNTVKRFNGSNGAYIDDYYTGGALNAPQSIVFFPDTDCCTTNSLASRDTTSVEMISSGSYVINMGITPQTVGNAIMPYGLVYELLEDFQTPVKWVIDTSKAKDGIDFSHNGVDYRGGPFIIPAEYITAQIDSLIGEWELRGVVGNKTVSDISVQVRKTINYTIHWTLDQDNGSIAEDFIQLANIPSTAYDWRLPNEIDCCNDVFVLPHADPGWASHNGLYFWNAPSCEGGCAGAVWAGCRSGSNVENSANPLNPAQTMNFLMKDPTGSATLPAVDHGDHNNGTPPYSYTDHSNPIMQFMDSLDGATQGGSEQIYLPTNGWRESTTVAVWDPSHSDVPGLSPGEAGVLAYGHAFGDEGRGLISYTGGHDIGGTDLESIAAQRSFFNFSIYATWFKSLDLNISVPDSMLLGSSYEVSAIGAGGSGTITYEWISTCPGSFLDPTAATTTFTPDLVYAETECIVTCIIKDDCNQRSSFWPTVIKIQPVELPPVAEDDFDQAVINNPVTVSVLSNDYDVNLDMDTSSINNAGVLAPANGAVIINNANGEITYTPVSGFDGIDSFEYIICDLTALCDTAQVIINVNCAGTPGQNIIEGTVFEDADDNGLQEGTESGVAGIKIRVYEDENLNGVINAGETPVDSVLTIADGSYSISVNTSFFRPDSIAQRVIQSSDDANEKTDGSMESLSSPELKIRNDRPYSGLRFANMNIPAGSVITAAYLELTAKENRSGTISANLYGEDSGSSASFLQMNNNISGRTRTTALVGWNIGSVEKDSVYQSPDIATVIQEIVDRSDWESGNRYVTLMLENTGTDEVKFKTYDHTAQEAPRLIINFMKPSAVLTQFITAVDSTTLPASSRMTTTDKTSSIFSFTGQTSCANDFGYRNLCISLVDGSPLPAVGLVFTTDELCDTTTSYLLSQGTPSGGTYSGTGVSGNIFDATVAGTGQHEITYSYTNSDGCTNSVMDTLWVYSQPAIAGVLSTNPTTCGGNQGTITVNASGGSGSYQYRINGGSWQSSNVFSSLSANSYTVEIRNSGGLCDPVAYTSNPVVLSDPNTPSLSANISNVDCNGNANGGIDLSVSGGTAPFTFAWSNGATTEDLTGLSG
ncbi:MAG: Ig-like domain-containing protein, partial [Bacteroidota bacterium]